MSSIHLINILPASPFRYLPQCHSPLPSSAFPKRRRSPLPAGFCHVAPRASGSAINSVPRENGTYTVADFMTKKQNLHVAKTTTTVDEALEAIVNNRISGLPVIDDDWNLVGVVSDYDLLAIDSISGGTQSDANLFPDVDSSWKLVLVHQVCASEATGPPSFYCLGLEGFVQTFNEIQKLLSKTNGKVVGDLMTPTPLFVHQWTSLEDAARLLLETKYRRLPVVDDDGKLVGLITRGNIVKAALLSKRAGEW